MDFFENLQNAVLRDDEITIFEAGENGYYAYLRLGRRIDIQRAFNFQPPIDNFDDYYSFMFVESLQGFFLFRQRVVENKSEPWHVFLEMTPRDPCVFYNQAWVLWLASRRR